mmetsp:Transcript_3808/g.12719  ORF Transcript_3808/g.12719 Transcript_3808/m.12719 type:complete len:418 (-) Transcript_3808:936-2189(-)
MTNRSPLPAARARRARVRHARQPAAGMAGSRAAVAKNQVPGGDAGGQEKVSQVGLAALLCERGRVPALGLELVLQGLRVVRLRPRRELRGEVARAQRRGRHGRLAVDRELSQLVSHGGRQRRAAGDPRRPRGRDPGRAAGRGVRADRRVREAFPRQPRLRLSLGRTQEEAVRERLEGRDTLRRVVGEELGDEVLELEVVHGRVARLASARAPGAARLHAQDVVQRPLLGLLRRVAERVATAAVRGHEVLHALGARADHGHGRHAEHLADLDDLVLLVHPGEEGLPRVHLHEDAPEAPHVDLRRIGAPEEHLGGAVEARLDVRVHALVRAAGGPKVDDLDGRPLGVPQQDVLRLEVAVDHGHLAEREEAKALEDLPRKLADQVEGDPAEVGVAQEVVEVVAQHLEDEALVPAVHEVRL